MSPPISISRVSFGGNTVKVISEHPKFANAIQTHFRHCGSQQTNIIATFHITAISENHFTAWVDDDTFFSKLDYEQALLVVTNEIITRLNAECKRGLVFHAAAVSDAEDAVILCGRSGSGKSSLAAWLIADGFHYLTDEIIEMPLDGNQIDGLTRSIVLKPDSAFIWQDHLPETKSNGFLLFTDGSAWIDPQLLRPDAVYSTATPCALVFPHYEPDVSLQTKKLTSAEALFRLMQTLVNARNLPGHGMDAAARLARQVKAFDLTYSDIEAAAVWIRQTIDK